MAVSASAAAFRGQNIRNEGRHETAAPSLVAVAPRESGAPQAVRVSTASLGAERVGRVMTLLASAGYRCARTSASGQRRGSRRDERGLAGDAIALSASHGYPHLLVEVGGTGKRLGVAFDELRDSLAPGFSAVVVRFVDRKCYWYVDEDHRFRDLADALDALRAA